MRLNLKPSRRHASNRSGAFSFRGGAFSFRGGAFSFRRGVLRTAMGQCVEALEPRRLMASGSETASPIPPILADPTNPSTNSIDLTEYFTDATLPGTLVTFNTSLGTIDVGLTDKATPNTVANFLSYVSSGAYTGTFFHRSAIFETDANGNPLTPSATTPADIIQAGAYNVANGSINQIPTNSPVQDEYTSEILGDTAGTLAMAKTSYANSATDQFYFNENDNSQALDTPTTDPNGVTTSYTVFGQVLGSGSLSVIKAIAELPVYNLQVGTDQTTGQPITTPAPVTGLTAAQIAAGATLSASNIIFINGVTSEPGTSYTVTSDVPTLVTPVVTNGVLSFNYASGQYGTAEITIKASNLDGTSASTTFPLTVPNLAAPTQGPVIQNSTSGAIQTGVQGVFHSLAAATDSISPLTLAGVTIVTPPTHGIATVDPTTGYIDYTSTTGFVGNDTLTYTVTDEAGNVSSPGTATIDVVPGPVKVTVGTAAVKGLIFTEPDGAVGKLTVTGGSAVVTFTDYQVATPNVAGVINATGAGTIITSIVVTNFPGQPASLTVKSSSPVSLGSVNDTGNLASLNAPTGTLTGSCSFGTLGALNVAATNGATLLTPGLNVRLTIGTATNTSLTGYTISSIKSKQWLNTDNGTHTVTALIIKQLDVTGAFADDLVLTGKSYDLYQATIGQPSGNWNIAGSTSIVNLLTPASTWSMTSSGIVQQLNVKGTLSNVIQAAAISSLKVIGSTDGAVVQTDASFSKKFLQIGRISISGAATNTVIFSAGNVGSISVGSMSGTRIYAGVALATAQAVTLPTALTDFTDDARIASVSVGKGTSTFSDSQINAETLGSLQLGDISTTAASTPFGITGHTFGAITFTLGGVKKPITLPAAAFKLVKVVDPTTQAVTITAAPTLTAYETKKKITLPDGFEILPY